MKTFNRNPANIDTTGIKNYSKYFNQMNFKGIHEDDNIYAIDQESFRDANNVYVNSDNKLVSRPTLQKDNIPSEIDVYQYDLIDVKYIGQNSIYINKSKTGTNYYFILLVDKDNQKHSIQNITDYHISTIEHYIICWNNVGAKVFDTSEPTKGWQNFNNFVEIPVTKVITGSTETKYDKNDFTTQYKEQYTYTNQSLPTLPSGDDAEIEVFTSNSENLKYTMSRVNEYTDYKIFNALRAPNFTGFYSLSGYNSLTKRYIIAIPDFNSVHISFNNGATYKTVLYPEYDGSMPHGANITEDGLYYCFVANDGVYFLNLDTDTWIKDSLDIDINTVISATFKTREIYSFIVKLNDKDTTKTNIVRLYFNGYSLYSGTDRTKDKILSYIEQVSIKYSGTGQELVKLNTLVDTNINSIQNNRIRMFETKNNKDEDIIIIAASLTKAYNKDYLLTVIGGNNMYNAAYSSPQNNEGMFTWASDFTNSGNANFNIIDGQIITPAGDDWVYAFNFDMIIDTPIDNGGIYNHKWKKATWTIKIVTVPYGSNNSEYQPSLSESLSTRLIPDVPTDWYYTDWGMYLVSPQKLEQGYIYKTYNGKIYFLPNDKSEWIEFRLIYDIIGQLQQFTVTNDKYFIVAMDERDSIKSNTVLITNLFSDSDFATITYTFGEKSNYTKIPNVSYSDTELYLAFGDLLQITRNSRAKDDVTKINFNLPALNNQSFIDDITAMVNISTTEVALFFLNKIVICSKVADSNLAQGFKYNYYNTKFSLGVRLGDTVMNTLEGQYTIFPTKRGLAIMNYQAFMATTDQVIQYITDDVRELWNNFYESNNLIKIIQWNNKLIFTNNTNIMLLYDLDRTAWWKWEVPIIINSAVTDQIDLRLIDTNLNKFKDATQYYDFGEVGQFKPINWFIMSQPLHMNAPNYYKNMRQLVFQFAEGDDNIVTKTMNAQIKLYRKRLSIKEPETIKFQIENLRTFVKRFNYWKINEIQWALGNDTDTNVPKQFELNAITIKYEIGDEVR